MKSIKELSVYYRKKVSSFLLKKPLWVSWITYSILSAIALGICYATIYLIGIKWWITMATIFTAGITWGSLSYLQGKPANEKE